MTSTPAAKWRENGESDPHGSTYDCERFTLSLGDMTDDELANAVFLHGGQQPCVEDLIAGKAKMPIVYLTAAKERIRWLSRALKDANHKLGMTEISLNHKATLPLYWDKCTKETIFDFWQHQGFDLNLPNNNGTTDWGNCDLCFLKGGAKKLSIIEQKPELADWWAEAEREVGSTFRNDHPSYSKMKLIASDQFSFGFDDTLAFCGCTD